MTTSSHEMIGERGLENLPRVRLAFLPTPIHGLPRLSEELGVELWLKRDDQTGLALGGNKARKLEFLMGDALAKGCDTAITTGGSQSNHARMTLAACRQLGLDCYLVLDRGRHPENGNLLLNQMLGANVEMVDDPDPQVAGARMTEVAEELASHGRRPYVIPRGGSVPEGAVGYFNMVSELVGQLREIGLEADYLYLATGSGGTHSGILAGHAALNPSWKVQGISVSGSRRLQEAKVLGLSNRLLQWLEVNSEVRPEDVRVDDSFVGEGYGSPTPATWSAIRRLALTEGVILDPVYTGKAMAGLLGHVAEGRIEYGATVIFLHTGGAPALFGYASEVETPVEMAW